MSVLWSQEDPVSCIWVDSWLFPAQTLENRQSEEIAWYDTRRADFSILITGYMTWEKSWVKLRTTLKKQKSSWFLNTIGNPLLPTSTHTHSEWKTKWNMGEEEGITNERRWRLNQTKAWIDSVLIYTLVCQDRHEVRTAWLLSRTQWQEDRTQCSAR